MDTGKLKEKAITFLKKYKYVLLILVIGISFMLTPDMSQVTNDSQVVEDIKQCDSDELCASLSKLLSQVDGAGEVEVLLTVAKGSETVYQTDLESDSTATTVTVSDAQRNETGLIQHTKSPVYQGAVVICQGADKPGVKLAITDAVSKATGLGANQIAVLKMK